MLRQLNDLLDVLSVADLGQSLTNALLLRALRLLLRVDLGSLVATLLLLIRHDL